MFKSTTTGAQRLTNLNSHFAKSRTFTSSRIATANMTDPSKYKFNHSMLRVKDPKASLAFYKHLGMSVVGK